MTPDRIFDALQLHDMRNERRIFWSEAAVIAIVALLVAAYLIALCIFNPGAAGVPSL